MSDRMIAPRGLAGAAGAPMPAPDGGPGSDPPPISGGELDTAEHLRFEVADAIGVAQAATGHLRALEEWLVQLPGRCRTDTGALPGLAEAVGSLRDIDLQLDRVAALLYVLSRLAEAAHASGPTANGTQGVWRDHGYGSTHDVEDCVDPTSLPVGALVSALSRRARGDYAHEAAVDLLARFGCPGGFWLRRPDFLDNCVEAWVVVAPDETSKTFAHTVDARIDGAALAALLDGQHIKSAAGELRVLHLVAGLLGHQTARPLSAQLIGLDEDTTLHVLRAVAHVGGWHERGRIFDVAVRDVATTDSVDVDVDVDVDAGACHE